MMKEVSRTEWGELWSKHYREESAVLAALTGFPHGRPHVSDESKREFPLFCCLRMTTNHSVLVLSELIIWIIYRGPVNKMVPGSLSLWPSHKSLKYSTAIKGRDEKLKGTDIKVGTYFSKHVKQLVIFILHLEISSGYKLLHLSLNWFPGKQNICLCTITQPPVSENRHKYPSSQSLVFNNKKNGMNGWCLTHRILCVYSAFGESSPPTTLPTLSWI